MKKIFILGLLLAPIMAHADNPVGPSAVPSGGTPVVATASAPYQTAAPANGDSTTVVSASYVKGAYNDAIAAVNKVNSDLSNLSSYVNNDIEDEIADKQDKLVGDVGGDINTTVIETETFASEMFNTVSNGSLAVDNYFEDKLITAGAVGTGIMVALTNTGVKAVTTWGDDDDTTNLSLTPINN